MAEWFEVKENFITWLKTQDVDFDENDKEFAPIKYSKQFKLFIEKHDGDENLNMDNFVKKDTQKMETDVEKANELEKEKEKLSAQEREQNGGLIEDMLMDYIADLDKDSKVFQTIDGILGDKQDGEISNAERNMFIQKVTLAALDDDATNFSFDDLVGSVTKIEDGDNEFINRLTNQQAQAPGAADALNNGYNPGGNPITEDSPETKVQKLSGITSKYEPKTIENKSLQINAIDTPSISFDKSLDIAGLSSERQNATDCISAAKSDFANFSSAFDSATSTIDDAQDYISGNEEQYNNVLNQLMEQNTHLKDTQTQITTFENTISEVNSALNVQYVAKDGLTTAISTTEGDISSLQSQIQTPSGTDEEKAKISERNSQIRAQIVQLEAQKEQFAQQLFELNEEILANKELLDETSQNLQLSYDNLSVALQNIEISDENSKEIIFSTLENKKVLARAQTDQSSAQAGMVAMDAYIKSLESKIKDIDRLIVQKEEEEASANEEAQEPTSAIEPLEEHSHNYQNVSGLAQTQLADVQVNEETNKRSYTCSMNGVSATVNIEKQGEKYVCTIEADGQTQTLTLDDSNLTMGIGEISDLYQNDGAATKINIDGKQINVSKDDESGYVLDVRFEKDHITTALKDGTLEIVDHENRLKTIASETTNDTNTTRSISITKDDKLLNEYVYTEGGSSQHGYEDIVHNYVDKDGVEKNYTYHYEANSNGYNVKHSTKDSDGNENAIEQTVNSKDKLVKNIETSIGLDENGEQTVKTVTTEYEYDENDNLVGFVETTEINGEKTVRKFDKEGNEIVE